MSVIEKIKEYLNEHNLQYNVITHEPAGSAEEYHDTLGTRYEQQAKALFIRYKKPGEKGFAILTLQAQKQADLNRVKELLEAKEVRLGTAEQLQEVTGCNFGELPPFGKLFGLQLLLDKELLNEVEIYFNAGSLTTSITLNPQSLVEMEDPILY